MAQVNRTQGLVGNAAIKTTCRLATTASLGANISGLAVIDGVQTVAGDRVLRKDEADQTLNGIWVADTGLWIRAQDFDGDLDVVQGTLIPIYAGAVNAATIWKITTAVPVPGTAIAFSPYVLGGGNATVTYVASIAALKTLPKTGTPHAYVQGYYGAATVGGGAFDLDLTDVASADNGGTIIVANDGGRWKRCDQNPFSLNSYHWGVPFDGVTDAYASLAKYIAWVKTFTTVPTVYRWPVNLGAGMYKITQTLDFTNTSGINLQGPVGSYINAGIFGYTAGPILDFSGSTMSGFNSLFMQSQAAWANHSTIGVLFALTATGGLNCSASNFYIDMEDMPTANGTIGSIGLLNIRAEEFDMDHYQIRANCPAIFSANSDLSRYGSGIAPVITSALATASGAGITAGLGSMGVVNGGNKGSLLGINFQMPCLLLHYPNSFEFNGYLSRVGTTVTANAYAASGQAIAVGMYSGGNVKIRATCETCASIAYVEAGNSNLEFDNVVTSKPNAIAGTLFQLEPSSYIKASDLNVTIPNSTDTDRGPGTGTRRFIYATPTGDNPIIASLYDVRMFCREISDNTHFINPALLRNANNVMVLSSKPFRKDGNKITGLTNFRVALGTIAAPVAGTVANVTAVDRVTMGSNNEASYRFMIDGQVVAGTQGTTHAASGNVSVVGFHNEVTIAQGSTSGQAKGISSVLGAYANSSTAQAAVTAVAADATLANGIWSVTITPTSTGADGTLPINFDGYLSVEAIHAVNGAILYSSTYPATFSSTD